MAILFDGCINSIQVLVFSKVTECRDYIINLSPGLSVWRLKISHQHLLNESIVKSNRNDLAWKYHPTKSAMADMWALKL